MNTRRRSHKVKRLGELGYHGYEQCLLFLMKLCNSEELADEEEAYAALLVSHQARVKAKSFSPAVGDVHFTQAPLPSKDVQEAVTAVTVLKPSEKTESVVFEADITESLCEHETDEQGPIKARSRNHTTIPVMEIASNITSSTISTAGDNPASQALQVSDLTLRHSISYTQLFHDNSSNMALASMHDEGFKSQAPSRLREHRRSVSDSQVPLLPPIAILASHDEQASSPSTPSTPSTLRRMRSLWAAGDEQSSSASGRSTPSTIRRMWRDSRESQATTAISTTNMIFVNRNLYELKCPI